MRLRCVLGIPERLSCEYHKCGECMRHRIEAYTNETMKPICKRLKIKVKECSICSTEANPYHYDKGEILCSNCFDILFIATGSPSTDKKRLKDLVARVRKDEHSKSPGEGEQ